MSILETLFNGEYRTPQETQVLSPELHSRRREVFEQIEGALPEENWDTFCDIERAQNLASFREGFRLGALLMLELADQPQ